MNIAANKEAFKNDISDPLLTQSQNETADGVTKRKLQVFLKKSTVWETRSKYSTADDKM